MAFASGVTGFRLFFLLGLVGSFFPTSYSLPFIVLHGIGDQCSNSGNANFTTLLSEYSNSKGYCVEVGNGVWDSWFVPLDEQVAVVCDKVKKIEELRQGYNIVGLSQGNLIGRGVIEFCDGGPPVKNFVSLGGPHAGIATVPLCGTGPLCAIVNEVIKSPIYSDFVQAHLAPSGYLKLPNAISDYLAKSRFLPKLNNEIPSKRNSTYKERFTSLQNLVLVMFEQDNVLIPRETSWFGYYPDGLSTPITPPNATKLYKEDWIGLRSLDEAGRVRYLSFAGKHVEISKGDMKKYVVPYLEDKQLKAHRKQSVPTNSDDDSEVILTREKSSYELPLSIETFFGKVLALAKEKPSTYH